MELIVRQGEREERVRVERDGAGYRVTVGENSYQVEAAVAVGNGGGGAAGVDLFSLRIDGAQYEVAVGADPVGAAARDGQPGRGGRGGRYRVSDRGGAVEVEVADPLTHLARAAGAGGAGKRSEQVTAMMPGRVVAVLAEEGAEVAAGQGILVLEAMKMENEILAEHPGVLQRLFVSVGQSVDGGEPLFEIR